MATKKEAPKFAKGARVRVLSGDWGKGNLGTVESFNSDRVLVVMDGRPDLSAQDFAADHVAAA